MSEVSLDGYAASKRSGTATPFKRLLYMCEYPPSTKGGAPIILRALLAGYDPKRLHILCDRTLYNAQTDLVKRSYLGCRHHTIPTFASLRFRPQRVFGPIADSINSLRIPLIVARGRKIISDEQIQAIVAVPWRCEFAIAAYRLHVETGVPLFVFETDDWEEMNTNLLPKVLTKKYHARILHEAQELWLTSPAMVRDFRRRFGVSGRFLFHFVDVDGFPAATGSSSSSELRLVYTGAINRMFWDCLESVCTAINSGIIIEGRVVTLTIYSSDCPAGFLGPYVTWAGFISSENIPQVLSAADGLLVCVSFLHDRSIEPLVRTSLYTKTVDYLASGTPVLVISPSYSGEADYFGKYVTLVSGCTPADLLGGFSQLLEGAAEIAEIAAGGRKFVREHHDVDLIERKFLSYFREVEQS
jgi:glycosyltransferase involved in cell wall biosynthesis